MKHRHSMHLAASLLTVGLLCGCATTAKFQTVQPASPHSETATQKIVVMPFVGQHDVAATARDAVELKIAQGGKYQLIPLAQHTDKLPRGYGRQRTGVMEDVHFARMIGADIVLTGDVAKNVSHGAGQGDRLSGSANVDVTLRLKAIDVNNGQLVSSDMATKSIDEIRSAGGDQSLSVNQSLHQLVSNCVDEVGPSLGTQLKTVEVELASSSFSNASADIKRGNTAAQKGDWLTAKHYYENALEQDKLSDAAMYNLAVAHEALGDYRNASRYYREAVDQNDSPEYQESLARANVSWQHNVRALAMLDRLPVSNPVGEPETLIASNNRKRTTAKPDTTPTQPLTLPKTTNEAYPSTGLPEYALTPPTNTLRTQPQQLYNTELPGRVNPDALRIDVAEVPTRSAIPLR